MLLGFLCAGAGCIQFIASVCFFLGGTFVFVLVFEGTLSVVDLKVHTWASAPSFSDFCAAQAHSHALGVKFHIRSVCVCVCVRFGQHSRPWSILEEHGALCKFSTAKRFSNCSISDNLNMDHGACD